MVCFLRQAGWGAGVAGARVRGTHRDPPPPDLPCPSAPRRARRTGAAADSSPAAAVALETAAPTPSSSRRRRARKSAPVEASVDGVAAGPSSPPVDAEPGLPAPTPLFPSPRERAEPGGTAALGGGEENARPLDQPESSFFPPAAAAPPQAAEAIAEPLLSAEIRDQS